MSSALSRGRGGTTSQLGRNSGRYARDTVSVIEGSRGCEPQTDPTCSRNFAPPESGAPGTDPEGVPDRGLTTQSGIVITSLFLDRRALVQTLGFVLALLAAIWDPFR